MVNSKVKDDFIDERNRVAFENETSNCRKEKVTVRLRNCSMEKSQDIIKKGSTENKFLNNESAKKNTSKVEDLKKNIPNLLNNLHNGHTLKFQKNYILKNLHENPEGNRQASKGKIEQQESVFNKAFKKNESVRNLN